MNINKLLLGAGVIVVVAVVFTVFSKNPAAEHVVMDGAMNGQMETVTPVVNPSTGTKEVTVVGSNFSFSPSVIKVKKGDKVTITFQNVDGFHDWKLDEFNAATKKISAGQEDMVTFTADKAGSFEYYCSVGSHRSMGMKGTLIVE